MKILAIEFSSDHRSVAVLGGGQLLAERTVCEGRNTAAVQLIEATLAEGKTERTQIDCISVGIGPGSYTGIRAAIALTQGWQVATGVRVQAVDSLEALALGQHFAGARGEITFAVDAARGEFYLAKFELDEDGIRNFEPTRLAKRSEFEALLASGQTIIGPSLVEKYPEADELFPSAEFVGRLAARRTDFIEASELEPVYLRKVDFVKAPPLREIPPA
jgi:tRNA threonylcarbamoyl adenosine modification protein YeaZ